MSKFLLKRLSNVSKLPREKLKNLSIWIFLIIFIGPIATQIAHACSPSPGDPWFKYSLVFDHSNIPKGIVVEKDSSSGLYVMSNSNDDPIYIFSKISDNITKFIDQIEDIKRNSPNSTIVIGKTDYYSNETFIESYQRLYPNSELPLGYIPKWKLKSNKSYFYSSIWNSEPKGWTENTRASKSIPQLAIDNEIPKSYIRVGDGRPSDVKIPESNIFQLSTFYKNEELVIKGTIAYSLNQGYDPKSHAKGIEGCNQLMKRQNNPEKNNSIFLRFIRFLKSFFV